MIYKIQVTPTALDCFKAIQADNPTVFARTKKLSTGWRKTPKRSWRNLQIHFQNTGVCVGDYRIVYIIQNENVIVTIIYAGYRKEVYKKLRGFLNR